MTGTHGLDRVGMGSQGETRVRQLVPLNHTPPPKLAGLCMIEGQHGHRGQDCRSQLHINNMNNTYNGWRNHATWAIGLHLMDTVVQWIDDDLGAWTTTDGADIGAAAQLFQDLVDEQIELADMPSAGLLMDLLDTSDVDWCALGRAALASSDRTSLEEVPA
jgi:hypothetical protein